MEDLWSMDDLETSETRKRAPNFSRKELKLLEELIKVYSDQINNKSTSSVSNAIKVRAWKELAKDFNAHMGGEVCRSTDSLKNCYKNMKKRDRHGKLIQSPEDNSNDEQNDENSFVYTNETLSGPDGIYRTPNMLKIRYENTKRCEKKVKSSKSGKSLRESKSNNVQDENDSTNDRTMTDDEESTHNDDAQNYAGSDALKQENDGDDEDESDFKELIRVQITAHKDDHMEVGNDTDTTSPEKSSKPSPRKVNRNFSNGVLFDSKIDPNADLETINKQCLIQEHKMRLRLMQEKHNAELECIRTELKERLKMMKDEHQRRLQLLELEKSVGIINKM